MGIGAADLSFAIRQPGLHVWVYRDGRFHDVSNPAAGILCADRRVTEQSGQCDVEVRIRTSYLFRRDACGTCLLLVHPEGRQPYIAAASAFSAGGTDPEAS